PSGRWLASSDLFKYVQIWDGGALDPDDADQRMASLATRARAFFEQTVVERGIERVPFALEWLAGRLLTEGQPTFALLVSRGTVRAAQKRWSEAAADFQQASDLSDATPEALMNLALLHQRTGDSAEHRANLEALLARYGSGAEGDKRLANDLAWVCV